MLFLAGCPAPQSTDANANSPNLSYDWQIKPTPPHTGLADCALSLREDGKPVENATVKIEGNMAHPGMQPSLAQLKESAPGVYKGKLNFTMGGDWFVLIDAQLRDGRAWQQKIDVPNVRSK